MSDFSLPTLFVVPVGNSYPTSGSTNALAAGQVGVFLPNYSAATAGTVVGAKYITIAQGRSETLYQGSKQSDKIAASKVKKWYKVVGQGGANNEIQEMSNFSAPCASQLTVTFRVHSSYADTISFNGITRSVTIQTPCCACGANPCDTVPNETIIDLILAKIAQEDGLPLDKAALKLSSFLTFEKIGTGSGAVLRVTGKALTKYGNPCDLAAFPWEYDRLWFRCFAYVGPVNTVDFIVSDACVKAADIVVTQRSTYPSGTSAEVEWMEKDYFSYQSYQKHLFRMPGYNQLFESWVTAGTVYNQFVIQFDELTQDDSFTQNIHIDERVIIFVPQASSAALEAILVAYLGAADDETATAATSTTTTSTTSTSTTSTTTLIP